MKKGLFCLLFILLLCGCTIKEKMTCTYTNTSKGNNFVAKMYITMENKKVVDITAVIDYEDETLADAMCKLYKKSSNKENVECKGNKITIKNYQKDLKESDLSKDSIKEYYEDQNYTCK